MRLDDPRLVVDVDEDATSPCIQRAIWRSQHQCVIEGFAPHDKTPDSRRCGEIIVKHQLAGDRGHYSVLAQAFVKLNVGGFPHSVVSQITRHTGSRFLVQSGRYTGTRFVKVATGESDVQDVFYFRPVGEYRDRQGHRYEYTETMRDRDMAACVEACCVYREKIEAGYGEEHARDGIPYNFRQNFTISSTVQAFYHWLDQRSKKDAQLEIQVFAAMAFEVTAPLMPEIAAWYKENRWGRARLAP